MLRLEGSMVLSIQMKLKRMDPQHHLRHLCYIAFYLFYHFSSDPPLWLGVMALVIAMMLLPCSGWSHLLGTMVDA